jgi:hypothetical protein
VPSARAVCRANIDLNERLDLIENLPAAFLLIPPHGPDCTVARFGLFAMLATLQQPARALTGFIARGPLEWRSQHGCARSGGVRGGQAA